MDDHQPVRSSAAGAATRANDDILNWSQLLEDYTTKLLLAQREHNVSLTQRVSLLVTTLIVLLVISLTMYLVVTRHGVLSAYDSTLATTVVFAFAMAATNIVIFRHLVFLRKHEETYRSIDQLTAALKTIVARASSVDAHRALSEAQRFSLELKLAEAEVALRNVTARRK